MKIKLSLTMITYNAEEMLEKSLSSIKGLVDEMVIIDCYSEDKTVEIAKKFGAKVILNPYLGEGKQRNVGLKNVRGEWVLALDDDEVVTSGLKNEILKILHSNTKFSGFKIPFQSYFMGRCLKYGGEYYHKLILFKRNKGYATNHEIHSIYQVKDNNIGYLKNAVNHYSYRSLFQLFIKFSRYAIRESKQKKESGETTSIKKIFLYPLHMFWARFVEDKGYKDGLFRIPLDLAFAYKEFLTYISMFFLPSKK